MSETLYADPQGHLLSSTNDFLVCKKWKNRWYVIEAHGSGKAADNAMKILSQHDLINGHIPDISYYQIFKKELHDIRFTL